LNFFSPLFLELFFFRIAVTKGVCSYEDSNNRPTLLNTHGYNLCGWMDGFEGLESRPLLGMSLSLGQVHWHQYIYLCHAGQFRV
jgi:hypothetical protein